MTDYRWLLYAVLSAVAAAFVGIFAKLGMPKDVDATLARILAEPRNEPIEAGKAQLGELLRTGRYQRDVY